MLNRNAEALFWIGRYMERAENHARLIDVHYHQQFEQIVDALGSREHYEKQYGRYNERDVLCYSTLDRENGNSLLSCISYARDNVRTLREKLPSEMWDTTNAFYLWLKEKQPEDILADSPHLFLERIKQWTAMFQGVTQSVMPRENEWHFIECGRYLERAENTLRIIRSVANVLSHDVHNTDRYSYLQTVLRSVSGYQLFRRYYADSFTADHVVEFVMMNDVFPRSIPFALRGLEMHMRQIELQDKGLRSTHERLIRQVNRMTVDLGMLERDDVQLERSGKMVEDLCYSCEQFGHAFAKTFFRKGEVSA